MAGDWIKMRVELYRDPKVIVMADLLLDIDSDLSRYINQHTQRDRNVTRNVMRNATVGALVAVWGIGRVQGKRINTDLFLPSVCISALDDIADLQGFGNVMKEVGWVRETKKGLIFPRFFEEYNADYDEQKKKNRDRQARFRESRKRNVTVTLHNAPREEKRREEYNTPLPPLGRSDLICHNMDKFEEAKRIAHHYADVVGCAASIGDLEIEQIISRLNDGDQGARLKAAADHYAPEVQNREKRLRPGVRKFYSKGGEWERWADAPAAKSAKVQADEDLRRAREETERLRG